MVCAPAHGPARVSRRVVLGHHRRMDEWIDTHCHLDAPEFAPDRDAVRARARAAGVRHCVIPAVERANLDTVRALAHRHGDSYALGIHPLYVAQAADDDLQVLEQALARWHDDPRLVAVGEIGLDGFVPAIASGPAWDRQQAFLRAQLRLARRFDLPVILHLRRSVDAVLAALRETAGGRPWRGFAHAFSGSPQQAQALVDLGLRLGFGGALTFERATRLRGLAVTLPLDALALETDAPDIPPHWLYATADARAAGQPQGRNEPGELPRIAAVLAGLRGMAPADLSRALRAGAVAALPRLEALL